MSGTGRVSGADGSGAISLSPGPAAPRTETASPAPSPPRPARAAQDTVRGPVGPTLVHLLVVLGWVWCAATCARVSPVATTTALVVVFGLLFFILMPFHRWACFLVLVAACAAEDAMRAWAPVRFNTLHYATLVLLPVAFLMVRPRARLPIPMIFWFSLCLWFALSAFWSTQLEEWRNWVTEYCGVAGLAMLTRQLATSPRRRRDLGLVFAFTGLAVVISVLVVFGTKERFGDVAGINANGVGRLAAMGMLMLAISSAESTRQRLLSPLNVGLYLALGVGLLLTQSRGSLLAILGAALTIALAQPRVHHRIMALAACLLLGAGLAFTALQVDPQAVQGRWRSTFENKDLAGATAGRSEIARTAQLMLRDHWIAGIGAGQFPVVYVEYSVLAQSRYHRGASASAHSGFVRIPTEGGLVAIMLLAAFYVTLWVGASRMPPGQRRAVARAIIIYMLIGLVSSEGIEKENWLAVGMLLVWFWEHRVFARRTADERAGGRRPLAAAIGS